jgi:hypothetical protein
VEILIPAIPTEKRMKKLILLSLSLFPLVLGSVACERHSDAGAPLTMEACDPYCEKLTQCSDDTIKMMASRHGATRETLDAARHLSSKRSCLSTCRAQIRPDNLFRFPQSFKFYQYFLKGQMECMDQPDCARFNVCRQAQLSRAIAEFPMDPTDGRRCEEACTRINECANVLVPRIYIAEFDKMPLDRQAEMIRRHGDRDRCLHSCRYASIKNRLDKKKMSSTIDENWEDLQPFMQCLAHTDCAKYTQCVTSQTSGTN